MNSFTKISNVSRIISSRSISLPRQSYLPSITFIHKPYYFSSKFIIQQYSSKTNSNSNSHSQSPITYSNPPSPPPSLNQSKPEFFDPKSPSPLISSNSKSSNFILFRIWTKLKEFAKFYKDGILQINKNRKQVNKIKESLKLDPNFILNRSQFQLLLRTKQDLQRLIPFIILLLIMEELVPLVVIYFPSMLPSTCVMPSQLEKMRKNHFKKRIQYLQKLSNEDWNILIQAQSNLKNLNCNSSTLINLSSWSPNSLPISILKLYNAFLNLSTIGTQSRLISILQNHLQYIHQDDTYLLKENINILPIEELRIALEERGFSAAVIPNDMLVKTLTNWLDTRKKFPDIPIPFLLSMSVFDTKQRIPENSR